jgi:hypothetical protein
MYAESKLQRQTEKYHHKTQVFVKFIVKGLFRRNDILYPLDKKQ